MGDLLKHIISKGKEKVQKGVSEFGKKVSDQKNRFDSLRAESPRKIAQELKEQSSKDGEWLKGEIGKSGNGEEEREQFNQKIDGLSYRAKHLSHRLNLEKGEAGFGKDIEHFFSVGAKEGS